MAACMLWVRAHQEAGQLRLPRADRASGAKDSRESAAAHPRRIGRQLHAVEECVRIFPDAPRSRSSDGLPPTSLLEHGHRALRSSWHPCWEAAPGAEGGVCPGELHPSDRRDSVHGRRLSPWCTACRGGGALAVALLAAASLRP